MTDVQSATLSNLSREERRFPPSPDFAAQASIAITVSGTIGM